MPFVLSAAQTHFGVANSRRITGTGNLSDLQTTLATIPAPFTSVFNGNTLTMSGGGTNIIIVMNGSLVERRVGSYNVIVDNRAHFCLSATSGSNTTTLSAAASAGATSISVTSAANIIVDSFLILNGVTTGGDNNSRLYRVIAVIGTTITLATPLASAAASGANVTIAGSSVLGDVSLGQLSSVHITYTATALPALTFGTDPAANNNPELCPSGDGALRFHSGSLTIANTNARQDMDWHRLGHVYTDNVVLSCMQGGGTSPYQHFFYGNFQTTERTTILKNSTNGGAVLESGGATPILNIPPFTCNENLGLGFTNMSAVADCTVQKRGYVSVGFNSAARSLRDYDPAYLYFRGPAQFSNATPTFEIFRTFALTWKTPANTNIASVAVPAKLVVIGGSAPVVNATQNIVTSADVTTFTGATVSRYLRQSQKAPNTAYTFDGVSTQTGFTDDAGYNIYLVSYGYAAQFFSVSAKPASAAAVTTDGFALAASNAQNALAAAIAYASVATAPFSFSETGSGTLTISANCTTDQIGQYLLKLAYGNPGSSFWRGILHSPVTLSGKNMDIGAISIVTSVGATVTEGALTSSMSTTSTITGAGTVSVPFTDANNAGSISVSGPAATDTVEMRKASDNSLIATRTGAGAFAVSPANVGVSVYFERKVGAVLVMSTQTTPVTLTAGENPDVPMFTGSQVQVANLDDVAKETTLQSLASSNQTEHDATQSAIAALPAAPTKEQIRAELEANGSKLDTAAKKSKAAWVNTL